MSLDKIVEEAIKNAQARGEFNNLPGQGKPIDLTEYFETPEELRMAQSILKNAGITSPEVTLLQEIARLRQVLASTLDEKQKPGLEKQIRESSGGWPFAPIDGKGETGPRENRSRPRVI